MSPFPYSIVFSDLDGTLLQSNHRVSAYTKKVVQAAARAGVPFVVVSARTPDAITPIVKELELRTPVISYSGALVTLENGEILKSTVISKEMTVAVLKELALRFPDALPNFYAGRDWFLEDARHPLVQTEREITGVVPQKADFQALLSKGILPHKILCMCKREACLSIRDALQKAFAGLSIVPSSDCLLEIMDASVSKSSGIRTLLSHLRLSAGQAVAFGDSCNDIDMLMAVGTGVAMQNAGEDVKKAAKALTFSNDEDGVARFLVQAGLSI